MRRRGRLWREIGLVLACKAVALGLLYVAFFMPDRALRVTPDKLAVHLLAPAGAGAER